MGMCVCNNQSCVHISDIHTECLDACVVSIHEMLCVFVYTWSNAF